MTDRLSEIRQRPKQAPARSEDVAYLLSLVDRLTEELTAIAYPALSGIGTLAHARVTAREALALIQEKQQ